MLNCCFSVQRKKNALHILKKQDLKTDIHKQMVIYTQFMASNEWVLLCESADFHVELSKDELKMKLQEATEVQKIKTNYSWCNFVHWLQASKLTFHLHLSSVTFWQGHWHIVLWAGSHTSLPQRQIWSSGDFTREGRTTHTCWYTAPNT